MLNYNQIDVEAIITVNSVEYDITQYLQDVPNIRFFVNDYNFVETNSLNFILINKNSFFVSDDLNGIFDNPSYPFLLKITVTDLEGNSRVLFSGIINQKELQIIDNDIIQCSAIDYWSYIGDLNYTVQKFGMLADRGGRVDLILANMLDANSINNDIDVAYTPENFLKNIISDHMFDLYNRYLRDDIRGFSQGPIYDSKVPFFFAYHKDLIGGVYDVANKQVLMKTIKTTANDIGGVIFNASTLDNARWSTGDVIITAYVGFTEVNESHVIGGISDWLAKEKIDTRSVTSINYGIITFDMTYGDPTYREIQSENVSFTSEGSAVIGKMSDSIAVFCLTEQMALTDSHRADSPYYIEIFFNGAAEDYSSVNNYGLYKTYLHENYSGTTLTTYTSTGSSDANKAYSFGRPIIYTNLESGVNIANIGMRIHSFYSGGYGGEPYITVHKDIVGSQFTYVDNAIFDSQSNVMYSSSYQIGNTEDGGRYRLFITIHAPSQNITGSYNAFYKVLPYDSEGTGHTASYVSITTGGDSAPFSFAVRRLTAHSTTNDYIALCNGETLSVYNISGTYQSGTTLKQYGNNDIGAFIYPVDSSTLTYTGIISLMFYNDDKNYFLKGVYNLKKDNYGLLRFYHATEQTSLYPSFDKKAYESSLATMLNIICLQSGYIGWYDITNETIYIKNIDNYSGSEYSITDDIITEKKVYLISPHEFNYFTAKNEFVDMSYGSKIGLKYEKSYVSIMTQITNYYALRAYRKFLTNRGRSLELSLSGLYLDYKIFDSISYKQKDYIIWDLTYNVGDGITKITIIPISDYSETNLLDDLGTFNAATVKSNVYAQANNITYGNIDTIDYEGLISTASNGYAEYTIHYTNPVILDSIDFVEFWGNVQIKEVSGDYKIFRMSSNLLSLPAGTDFVVKILFYGSEVTFPFLSIIAHEVE